MKMIPKLRINLLFVASLFLCFILGISWNKYLKVTNSRVFRQKNGTFLVLRSGKFEHPILPSRWPVYYLIREWERLHDTNFDFWTTVIATGDRGKVLSQSGLNPYKFKRSVYMKCKQKHANNWATNQTWESCTYALVLHKLGTSR